MNEFEVDGTLIPFKSIAATLDSTLNAIAFTGNDGYPSFSIYCHVIRYSEGKTYLAFLDLAA